MGLRNVITTFLFLISLFIAANEVKSDHCSDALVANIADESISASSETGYYEPSFVKFGKAGWSPSKIDQHPWVQIDLGDLYLVCGVKVQGCKDRTVETWVTRFRVQVSPEENFWDTWNYIKPEFYGGKSPEEIAYSKAKERKVGRYVKIYPLTYVAKKSKHHSACLKADVYGSRYLNEGQPVFMRVNFLAMTYEKMKVKTLNRRIHEVDLVKGNRRPTRRSFYPKYTEVIPQYEPLEEELRVNSCVLAPLQGQFLSGRLHDVKEDLYLVEMLWWSNQVKLGRPIKLFKFRREQLQVVFSAWCEKIDFVARVSRQDAYLSAGQIVRVDSQLHFLKNIGGTLYQISYQKENRRKEDFVSTKKVEPNGVTPGKTKLWLENSQGYLVPSTAPTVNTANWIERHNVWYKENGDKPKTCQTGEIEKGQCHDSRIPFKVVRQNCTIASTWNGMECKDEDECTTGMASCGLHAACKNIPGFYKCFCPKGFTGDNPRTKPCLDVDECKKKVCHKDAICKNTIGSFTCPCKTGFQGDGRKSCVDKDECKVLANKQYCEKHKNALCNNLPGGFQCKCKPGYHGDFKQCNDLDECHSKQHNCSPHADCINTLGSYHCKCKNGFSGDGLHCKDIKECNDPSTKRKCHSPHGQCMDTPGGFKCECKEGYVGDGIRSCVIANECSLGIHKCDQWATCVDTRKSYDCHCNKGFEGDGRSCKDIDECARKEHNCGLIRDGIECVNMNGSYKCVCAKGFTGDGKKCVNIDECKTGTHNCVKDAICTDTKGSFSCRCRHGFYGDPRKKCAAETECMNALPYCDVPRAICDKSRKDDKIHFSCFCKSGFTGENRNCTDIDECVDRDANQCSKDAVCVNTIGGYQCRCKVGFVGDGLNCSDVNECSDKTRCPENAICANNQGSFECRCKTGFHGEAYKQCLDVDECGQFRKCGSIGQTCVNTIGSFYCKCKDGFKSTSGLANLTCQDVDECKIHEKPCGRYHALTCENTPGDYFCRCEHGFEFHRKRKKCEDINECDMDDYPCVDEATCINNEGDFECACPEGYHGNGKYHCGTDNSASSKATEVWSFLVAVITALLISSAQQG